MMASALMCGAVLFSCTKELENPVGETYDYYITACSEASATKAELSSDNTILWQAGDEISVLSNTTSNDRFVLTGGQQTTEGTFGGSLSNPGMSHVGVYPYNGNHSFGVSGLISWGKGVQIATSDDFDPEACLMAGQMSSDGKIAFKNLCSYIKFKTDFACTSIEISCKDDQQCLVSNLVTLLFDGDGEPSIDPVQGAGTYRTVTLAGKDDELIPAGTYYVAVLPQKYNGLTFTFNTEIGIEIVKSTKAGADITINRNVIYNVGEFLLDKLLPDGPSGFYGAGTKDSPYLISSLAKLQKFAEIFSATGGSGDFAGKYFLQTCDIDCKGNQLSIGSEKEDGDGSGSFDKYTRMFSGVYDGGGYTISNYKLKIWSTATTYFAGLFDQVYQGTIQNLNVCPAVGDFNTIVDLSGFGSKEIVVGALIAKTGADTPTMSGDDGDVTVSNCHLLGQKYLISGTQSTVFGGLIGCNVGEKLTVLNCSNEADLVAGCDGDDGYENKLGGLIGELKDSRLAGESYAEHMVIDRCRNNGDITLISTDVPCFAGGFVGSLSASKLEAHVSNSVNSGTVMTSSNGERYYIFSEECGASCAGGFFGFLDEDTSTSYFHNCLNKGSVLAYSSLVHARAGGFIGYSAEDNNVSQGKQSGSKDHVYAALCVNTGSIIGKDKAAFCATVNGMKCIGCLWLDPNNYSSNVEAAMPYRLGVTRTADTSVDDYYYSSIDPGKIVALLGTMMAHNANASYTNYAKTLSWGSLTEWKGWAVAWTGSASWGKENTLDLNFDAPIAQ